MILEVLILNICWGIGKEDVDYKKNKTLLRPTLMNMYPDQK